MLLAVDMGNTNITLGAYSGRELLFVSRLDTNRRCTEDQYAVELLSILDLYRVERREFTGSVLSSVVPELTGALKNALKIITGREPVAVGPGVKTGLNIKSDDASQLGADLVCGAVAALALYPMPCLICDLGTATKISVLDESGAFCGCTISAGVGISLDALATRTSQLPHIGISAPESVIGANTADCMRAGAVLGTAAMLDGLCERIEEELGAACSIVATGGLAKDIVPHCKRNIPYRADLLLEGLRIIYEKNIK